MWLKRSGFHREPIYPPVAGPSGLQPSAEVHDGNKTAEARVDRQVQRDKMPSDHYEVRKDMGFGPVGGDRMSADTMTDKLTDGLKGKTDILNSKIADLNVKMDAVFTDAHVAADTASAHLDNISAAVARLKETLPA